MTVSQELFFLFLSLRFHKQIGFSLCLSFADSAVAIAKALDPFHPAFGAVQCPRAYEFIDGPGGRGPSAATLIFDVAMHENYDVSFPGHAGQGPRAAIEQAEGDAPLRRCT